MCKSATAHRNWQLAVERFNELLHVDSCHAEAYFCRARAFAELKTWDHALADFSAAIHLNPTNAKAFYYRGCLLHKYAVLQFL